MPADNLQIQKPETVIGHFRTTIIIDRNNETFNNNNNYWFVFDKL